MAVRLGARHIFDCDITGRAGFVFDDYRLAGSYPDFLSHEPRDRVGAAAWREANDEINLPRRIVLCHGGGDRPDTIAAAASASRRVPRFRSS